MISATFGPSVSINDVTVAEEVGNAIFTVTLNLAKPGGFNINYSTANGTAIAGSDYTTTSGTLSFVGTIGETRTISVPIINNSYGESAENFFVNLSGGTNSVGISKSSGTGAITDTDPPIPNNTPLTLVDEFSGYFDYSTTGGTLRTQDNSSPCTITTTSSNTLLSPIPAGAVVKKAYLYWAHSSPNPDEIVTFEGQAITASTIYGSSIVANGSFHQFYGYVADVSTLVSSIPNPSTNVFDFSGLTIDNGAPYCTSATVLGGWSLMVFYELSTLPAVTINLYQGFNGESNNTTSFTLGGFFAIGASGAKTTVLSWEGDQTLSNNERLSVTSGLGTYTLAGDGDNNGVTVNNPFNSTIFDNTVTPNINQTNSHGLDLDTYNISAYIQPGETTVTTTVQSGQDFVMMNAVLLKVPSNLITGTVFEDINYGGGLGRTLATSSGIGTAAATVELYNTLNALVKTTTSKPDGTYSIGGMANGNYKVRVVNSTVKSNRIGGTTCNTCVPIQTFRRNYATIGGFSNIANRIGGAIPSGTDPGTGTVSNAQSVSTVTITSEGVIGLDFGFNFNTIVNTNTSGQGSLEQFIVNSNNLGNTGMDIVANSIFDPASGVDTSIFMIPPTGDSQGRTADANYISGYFDILIPNGSPLSIITDASTSIDGRTQTAYSGNTNTGTVGSGGSSVGTSAVALPNYDRPEIQVHRNNGDVIKLQGTNDVVRNIAVYGGNNAGIQILGGSCTISNSLLSVNALGVNAGNVDFGVEITGGTSVIDGNFISTNRDNGILVDGGTSTLIQNNHITANGNAACDDNIKITSGSGIVINHNLISNAAALGIDADGIMGSLTITENSITGSGQNGGNCSGNIENAGIKLDGNNSIISNNILFSNGGAGIVLGGGNTTGNLISQNSMYANGTTNAALGIDLEVSDQMGDGVSLNDNGDTDNGPNGMLNFPVISGAYVSGSTLTIEGWSRPGAIIEIFLTDISQGSAITGANQLGKITDYGEGQIYVATTTEGSASDLAVNSSVYTDQDGNTDNTNKFKFTVPKPSGLIIGNFITATATIANSTSEFSPSSIIKSHTVITNRRITYRVIKN